MPEADSRLAPLRRAIDQVDDAILELVRRRAGLVGEVAAAKRQAGEREDFLRPGREARILRRLAEQGGGALPTPALLRIWRELLCALLPLQGAFSVAVGGPSPALWETARDFYGSHTAMRRLAHGPAALAAVAGGEDRLAVVAADDDAVMARMAAAGGAPGIVWRLPFAAMPAEAGERRDAFVLSGHGGEASGQDVTVLALDTKASASPWPAAWRVLRQRRCPDGPWLLEIEGFHPAGHRLAAGGGLTAAVLGAYPAPLAAEPSPS